MNPIIVKQWLPTDANRLSGSVACIIITIVNNIIVNDCPLGQNRLPRSIANINSHSCEPYDCESVIANGPRRLYGSGSYNKPQLWIISLITSDCQGAKLRIFGIVACINSQSYEPYHCEPVWKTDHWALYPASVTTNANPITVNQWLTMGVKQTMWQCYVQEQTIVVKQPYHCESVTDNGRITDYVAVLRARINHSCESTLSLLISDCLWTKQIIWQYYLHQ